MSEVSTAAGGAGGRRRDLSRETAFYAGALVVSGLVQVAFLPFMSRFLTAEAAGELGALRVIAEAVAGIVVLGLPTALIRAWQMSSAHRSILVRGILFPLAPALLLAVLVYVFRGGLSGFLNLGDPSILTHALLLGTAVAYVQISLSFSRAEGLAGTYLTLQLVRGLVSLGALWAFLRFTAIAPVPSFMTARWAPSFAIALAAIVLTWRRTAPTRLATRPPGLTKDLFAFSLPLIPASLSMIVLSSADMFMLRNIYPVMSESGYYEWASRACLVMMPLILGFDMAWKRFIFRKRDSGGTIAELGRAGLLFMVMVNWMALVLAMASPLIVAAVGGGSFWPAVKVLPTLAGACAMYGLFLISQTGCLLTGQTRFVAMMTAFGAVLNIGFNLRLIPIAGATGAAFATLGTNLFMAMSLFWLGRKVFPISFLVVALMVIPPIMYGPLANLSAGWRAAIVLAGSVVTALVIWILRLMGTTIRGSELE